MKHKFKILSIDGGGIRGIIPANIINLIETDKGSIAGLFDLIAGTSTGGIIALALASPEPLSAFEIKELYEKQGSLIFKNRQQKGILSSFASLFNKKIKTLSNHPYDSTGIDKLMLEKFGNFLLSDCSVKTIITSYDTTRSEAFYFISRLEEAKSFYLRDVARATSAAPSYFPPKTIERTVGNPLHLIDGGVFANNPSVLALAEAMFLLNPENGTKQFSSSDKSNPRILPDEELPFLIVSLGTGSCKRAIDPRNLDTTGKWIEPLIEEIFMESVSENTHFLMKQLLPNFSDGSPRYIRINIPVPKDNMKLDDVSQNNIDALNRACEEYLDNNSQLIDKLLDLL